VTRTRSTVNEIELTHVNLNDQTLEGFRIQPPGSACNTTRRRRRDRTIRIIFSTISEAHRGVK